MLSLNLSFPEFILSTEPLAPLLFLIIESVPANVIVAPFTSNTAPSPVEVLFSITKSSSLTSLVPPADKKYPLLLVIFVIDTLLISAFVGVISINLLELVMLSNTTLSITNLALFAVINPLATLVIFVILEVDITTLPPVALMSF